MSVVRSTSSKLFSIGQVSKILNVHPNTLRIWDKNGVFQSLRPDNSHIRRYTQSQIDNFLSVHQAPSPAPTSRDLPLATLSRDFICILDQDLNIIYANRSFKRKISPPKLGSKQTSISQVVSPSGYHLISRSSRLKRHELLYQNFKGKKISVELDLFPMQFRSRTVKVLIARDVTKQKQSTRELQFHKDRLELINQQMQGMFDHSPAGIALFEASPQLKLLSHNLVYQKIWASPGADIASRQIDQFIPGYQNSRLHLYFQKAISSRHSVTFRHLKFDRPATGPVWLDGEISPIVINHRLVALTHMVIDVTTEVQTQQKLRQQVRQLRLSQQRLNRQNHQLTQQRIRLNLTEQASRLGSFEWTIGSTHTIWTRQLERIYGLKPGQFKNTYQEWIKMIHPDDRHLAENAVSNAINNGWFETEYRIIWPDYSTHWLYCRGKVFYDSHGRPQTLVGINMDITQRKLTEAKLMESEQRFRLIAEHMIDIVSIFNRHKTFVYVSPSISLHFRQPPGYFLNKTINQVGFPPRLVTRLSSGLDRVFTTKKPHVSDFTYQGRYYQSILAPEFNSTRHVNSVIAATRDVTELRQLEKRKDEFLSIASHELKTPLSSIKAYSQILQQSYASFSTDQRVAILSKQNQHIDRLNRLISDLLDLSRIQSGRFQFTYTVFDFDTVVRESVESVQSFTTSHRLVIKGSVGLKVKADRHRLEQVLVNLLTNAVKYSPDSNRVIIRQSVDNGCVVVSVQDFGIGIAPSDQKHIFQRFYRTPAVEKQYSGLGIGLYISDQIIRRHKGKLTFTSTPNKGSVFKFSLPLNHLKPHD